MKQQILSNIERKILKAVVERRRFLTASSAAKISGVSWNTANKYINIFYNRGWLSKRTVGNRTYWKARLNERKK